jgi:hypothetical protein
MLILYLVFKNFFVYTVYIKYGFAYTLLMNNLNIVSHLKPRAILAAIVVCCLLLAIPIIISKNKPQLGYLLNMGYDNDITSIHLDRNQFVFHQWKPWSDFHKNPDLARSRLHSVVDWQEARYLFTFHQRPYFRLGEGFIDPIAGIEVVRYDLHTGDIDRFTIDSYLHATAVAGGNNGWGRINAIDKDTLLIQHNDTEDLHRIEIFSIPQNEVITSYSLVRDDFPEILSIYAPYLTMLHYDAAQEHILLSSNSTLHQLHLPTMQVERLDAIHTTFSTKHPKGYSQSARSLVRQHALVQENGVAGIYHLPTMQMLSYLPNSLPEGDYYLVDTDLILVHTSYYTPVNLLWNIFGVFIESHTSTSDLMLYRLTGDRPELLWKKKNTPRLGWDINAFYLPQLHLPSDNLGS